MSHYNNYISFLDPNKNIISSLLEKGVPALINERNGTYYKLNVIDTPEYQQFLLDNPDASDEEKERISNYYFFPSYCPKTIHTNSSNPNQTLAFILSRMFPDDILVLDSEFSNYDVDYFLYIKNNKLCNKEGEPSIDNIFVKKNQIKTITSQNRIGLPIGTNDEKWCYLIVEDKNIISKNPHKNAAILFSEPTCVLHFSNHEETVTMTELHNRINNAKESYRDFMSTKVYFTVPYSDISYRQKYAVVTVQCSTSISSTGYYSIAVYTPSDHSTSYTEVIDNHNGTVSVLLGNRNEYHSYQYYKNEGICERGRIKNIILEEDYKKTYSNFLQQQENRER